MALNRFIADPNPNGSSFGTSSGNSATRTPFWTRREIDHSENSGFISHTNFFHAGTDTRHGLPILRIEPTLNPIQFKAQRVLGGFRKPPYVLPAAAHPDYRLHEAIMPYLAFLCNMWHKRPRLTVLGIVMATCTRSTGMKANLVRPGTKRNG